MTCRAKGQELTLCKQAVQQWEKKTGHTVEIVSLPQSSSESFALTQQQLSAHASDVDVYQVDTTWVSFLSTHAVPLDAHFSAQELAAHFPVILQNNTVNGTLIVAPWYADVDMLFYRKDLLEKYGESPPTSWEDLLRIAQKIQENERASGHVRLWGYIFRGKAYEGLTCHVVEWIESFGGTLWPLDTDRVIQAFAFCARLIPTTSPMGVLSYTEEEVRGVFQLGDAVFAHNWPYMWTLTQSEESPVKGKVGITVLPQGQLHGKPASVLGGWGLCVSRYSNHQEAAIDLVRWLTRSEEQHRRALQASYCPTIHALYQDPVLCAAHPFFVHVARALETVVLRPAGAFGRSYSQVSASIANVTQKVLLKAITPEAAAQKLDQDMKTLHKRVTETPATQRATGQ
jgi:trehalose/maltose transport system substrate-binding protein